MILTLVPVVMGFSLKQEVFKGYRMLSSTGNESIMYDVNIIGTEICLKDKLGAVRTRQYCYNETFCKDITYPKETSKSFWISPTEKYFDLSSSFLVVLSAFQKTNLSNMTEYEKKLYDIKQNFQLSVSDTYGFCIDTLNPLDYLWQKLGDQSVIIQGSSTFNTTDNNITQENNILHLETNNSYLVAMWPFDVTNESFLYDYTGNRDATMALGVEFNASAGYDGNGALKLNGGGERIYIENFPDGAFDINKTEGWTFSAMVKFSDITDRYQALAGTWYDGSNDWVIQTDFFGGQEKWTFYTDGALRATGDDMGLSANRWYHFLFTGYNNRVLGYFDDVLMMNGTYPQPVPSAVNNKDFWIATGGSVALNGHIDHVFFMNRTVSKAEITAIYQNTSTLLFKEKGISLFNYSFDMKTDQYMNVSFWNCTTPPNTNITFQFAGHPEVKIDSCKVSNYKILSNRGNQNLTAILRGIGYSSPSLNFNGTVTSLTFYNLSDINNVTVNRGEYGNITLNSTSGKGNITFNYAYNLGTNTTANIDFAGCYFPSGSNLTVYINNGTEVTMLNNCSAIGVNIAGDSTNAYISVGFINGSLGSNPVLLGEVLNINAYGGAGGLPFIDSVILNSTNPNNYSSNNITRYVFTSDTGIINNITDWRVNGTSIAVLNYPFEAHDLSSTNVTDYSTFSNNGTVKGATFGSSFGYAGTGAYKFDGVNDYIAINNDTELMLSSFSVSFWLNLSSNSSASAGFQTIFSALDSNSFNSGYIFLFDQSAGDVEFWVYNSTGGVNKVDSEVSITENSWHYYVGVFDGNYAKLYQDGVLLGTSPYVDAIDYDDVIFEIGRYPADIAYLNGTVDDLVIWNRSLSVNQISVLSNGRKDLIVSDEIAASESWQSCVVPNDGTQDGLVVCSNNLTIIPQPISLTLNDYYGQNSSLKIVKNFSTENIEQIETVKLLYTLNSGGLGNIDSWYLNYSAGGQSSCATGNLQEELCYNLSNPSATRWIQFINGSITSTYDGIGGNQGDKITPMINKISSTNWLLNLTIDEHYNPNIFKHYDALYNFSDVKWQTGANQRINQNKLLLFHVQHNTIPLNADRYKLDFRANYTRGANLPTQPLLAYGCNSDYTVTYSGNPDSAPPGMCALIASKLPSEFQDDGTKFRGIFSQNAISGIGGNLTYIVLDSDINTGTSYYYIKTYKATALSYGTHWNFSTNNGLSYSNLGDGYESEMNINWFFNGAAPTNFTFRLWFNTTDGSSTYTEGVINWTIINTQPLDPIVNIITPVEGESISNNSFPYNFTWTAVDFNNDKLNITLWINSTDTNITLHYVTGLNQSNNTYIVARNNLTAGNYRFYVYAVKSNNSLFFGSDLHNFKVVLPTPAPGATNNGFDTAIALILMSITLILAYLSTQSESISFKVFFMLALLMMIASDFRFAALITEASYPDVNSFNQTVTQDITDNLNTHYKIFNTFLYTGIFVSLVVTLLYVAAWYLPKRKKRKEDEEWEDWL